MGLVLRYLRKKRRMVLLTTALSAASGGLTMFVLRRTFDAAGNGSQYPSAHALAIGVGLLLALLATSSALQALLARLEGDLVQQLRTEISERFLALEYETLINRKHLVFGAIIEDIGRINPLVMYVPQVAYNLIIGILCLGYLATVSLPLLGAFLAFILTALGVMTCIQLVAREGFDKLREAENRFFESVRTISEAKKELSLNAARSTHFVTKILQPAIELSRKSIVRVHTLVGVNIAWSSVTVIGAAFVVVYLGEAWLELPLAKIAQFVAGALFLMGPLTFVVEVGPMLGRGLASLRHLERIGLDLDSELETMPCKVGAGQLAKTWQRIRIQDVQYKYPAESDEERFGIGPLNLEIRRGELIFITGGNGSGKSTLLLLICGLLRPNSGILRIDDRLVRDELIDYRSRFGGVFGDFFLFTDVLDATGDVLADDQVNAYLQDLSLTSATAVKNGALSKLTLSTGQRKRLALLQCYAEDREILFFDEWAADQDATFREHFYTVILPELKRRGKTILVISHDNRYFGVADRMLQMENGLIVSGSDSRKSPILASAPGSASP